MISSNALSAENSGPTITVGEILVEIVSLTPGEGFSQPLPLSGPYPSGAPAIFIDQCARLDGDAGMIGSVGNDDFGKLNITRLHEDGVDTSGVSVDATLPTGSAFVRYCPDGNRDFVFNITASAAANLSWNENVAALVSRAGHIHIMGTVLMLDSAWEIIKRAVDVIKSRGGSVSLDPNIRKELVMNDAIASRFNALLQQTDLLLPSGEELLLAAREQDQQRALQALFALGIKEVVLKQGEQGATCFTCNGEVIHSAAFQVEEVDPTGAGDCFGGAYVACRRKGMAIAEALEWANAAGARNVTFRGPMEGASTTSQLQTFMQTTTRYH